MSKSNRKRDILVRSAGEDVLAFVSEMTAIYEHVDDKYSNLSTGSARYEKYETERNTLIAEVLQRAKDLHEEATGGSSGE